MAYNIIKKVIKIPKNCFPFTKEYSLKYNNFIFKDKEN